MPRWDYLRWGRPIEAKGLAINSSDRSLMMPSGPCHDLIRSGREDKLDSSFLIELESRGHIKIGELDSLGP